MISGFLVFLSSILHISWSLIFLFIGIITRLKIYKVDGRKLKTFVKTVKHSSIWNDDEPDGWILGYYYFGYIINKSSNNRGDNETYMYIITTPHFYNTRVNKINKDTENVKAKQISYYEREGMFWNIHYVSIPFTPLKLSIKPKQSQLKAISSLLDCYNSNKYAVALLYGDIGSGKSIISLFLARNLMKQSHILGVSIVDTFNPTDPGDTFISLYTKINPTAENPLIITLEEVDNTIIIRIHEGIEQPREIPISIKNKADWNKFLDNFDRKLFLYVILLMTTNNKPEYFDTLDASYFRNGRVSLKLKI